jgi:hypothetical protein
VPLPHGTGPVISPAQYVPTLQGAHTGSAVAVPSMLTAEPGAHCVHGTHTLAGFASSSQVPAAQGTAVAVPPAQ